MKKVVWIAGVILVLVMGYVAAGPYLTVWEIKSGIVEQDSEKLSANIEFPTLRHNLKEQLNAKVVKNTAAEVKDNPFAAFATALATKMVDGIVDSLITPNGLAALMEGKKPPKNTSKTSNNGSTTGSTPPKEDDLFKNARFSYDSFSKFSIWVSNEKGEETRFVLQRDGLSWKLVNLVIPFDEKP